MAIRFTITSRGRCVCEWPRSTTRRKTNSISMSDVVQKPHQTYIYTQKATEPPVNYTFKWLHDRENIQAIYIYEKYVMNDWHLTTEVNQKQIMWWHNANTTEIRSPQHHVPTDINVTQTVINTSDHRARLGRSLQPTSLQLDGSSRDSTSLTQSLCCHRCRWRCQHARSRLRRRRSR